MEMTMKDIAIFGQVVSVKSSLLSGGAINRAREIITNGTLSVFDDSIEAGTSISHFGKVLGGSKL